MARTIVIAVMCLIMLAAVDILAQENWPQWRGPEQNGVSKTTNVPETWSDSENIVWKAPMPSWSGGTPIVWGNQIFVTSPAKAGEEEVEAFTEEAKRRQEERQRRNPNRRRRRGAARHPGGSTLLLISISKKDGSALWQRELDEGNKIWRKHNNTSPSPVTDGKHVWVVTGNGTVSAFDMTGKKIWQRNLQDDYGPFGLNWGYASSPILYDGKLILQVLHGQKTDDPSYVVAFDALSGNEKWRQERPTDALAESPDAYTTPTLVEHDGKTHIVILGGDYLTGHDPETGEEIWRAGGLNPDKQGNYRIVASPIVIDGMIYAPTRKKPLLAFRAGDIASGSPAWKWEGPAATDVPTPVCDGKYFYMVDDRGLVICLDAKTGAVVWGPERTAQGIVSASPVLADNKLYITNEKAITTVLAAGPEFKLLSTNELDGSYTISSPAVADSKIFIRTSNHLYCIGNQTD